MENDHIAVHNIGEHLISQRSPSVRADQQTFWSSERGRKWTFRRVGNCVSAIALTRRAIDRLSWLARGVLAAAILLGVSIRRRGVRAGPATAGGHGGQAGGARNRRGRRIRRALRGRRPGRHPLARQRLSRQGPFPGRRAGQQGRPALHHRPAPLPGGLRCGQVAGRRRQTACSNSPRRSSSAPKSSPRPATSRSRRSTTAGANISRPQAQIAGRDGGADARASLDLEFTEIRAPLVGPHRPPAGVGRQPRAAGLHAADHHRLARPDRLLFRRR